MIPLQFSGYRCIGITFMALIIAGWSLAGKGGGKGKTPGSGGGGASYYGDFDNLSGDVLKSDSELCAANPDHQYCDGLERVMIASPDGGQGFVFSIDAPKGKDSGDARYVFLDLNLFPAAADLTGEQLIRLFFQRLGSAALCDENPSDDCAPTPAIDLHALCDPTDGNCASDCYLGSEQSFDVAGTTPIADLRKCQQGEGSALALVGLFFGFGEGPKGSGGSPAFTMDYGLRVAGEQAHCGTYGVETSLPVLVRRTGCDTWEIEGYTACLREGGMRGDVVQGATAAPFLLTLTEIDAPACGN